LSLECQDFLNSKLNTFIIQELLTYDDRMLTYHLNSRSICCSNWSSCPCPLVPLASCQACRQPAAGLGLQKAAGRHSPRPHRGAPRHWNNRRGCGSQRWRAASLGSDARSRRSQPRAAADRVRRASPPCGRRFVARHSLVLTRRRPIIASPESVAQQPPRRPPLWIGFADLGKTGEQRFRGDK